MNENEISRFKGLMFLFLVMYFPFFTCGNIQGSAHDFSVLGWASGEICLPCHTPHNADTTVTGAPLWNHQLTTTTFTLYSSPTMDSTPEQPRSASKICLSCHDGTTAMDSYGGNIGSNYITGDANLGIDLSDDHPISIFWSHQTELPNCTICHNPNPSDFNPILPLFDMYIECPTCHDPHNTSNNPRLLRKPLAASEICFHCHGK
jgi:predicted CXXCH cytochrome family protein